MKKSLGDALALISIKTTIDAHQLSRFELGKELYRGLKHSNKWRRRRESMTSYLKYISTLYPELSLRTYTRHYRVYEKLIVEAKLNIFILKDIDFSMLVTVAECEALGSWQRRHIIERVHAYMQNGMSKKFIRQKFWEYIAWKRFPNPRFKDLDQENEEEIVARVFTTESLSKK